MLHNYVYSKRFRFVPTCVTCQVIGPVIGESLYLFRAFGKQTVQKQKLAMCVSVYKALFNCTVNMSQKNVAVQTRSKLNVFCAITTGLCLMSHCEYIGCLCPGIFPDYLRYHLKQNLLYIIPIVLVLCRIWRSVASALFENGFTLNYKRCKYYSL